jgi:hypothetical protein
VGARNQFHKSYDRVQIIFLRPRLQRPWDGEVCRWISDVDQRIEDSSVHRQAWEHHAFVGVHYISKLNTNIISMGQLDEVSFNTMIYGGVMKIRDQERRLLTKVLGPQINYICLK